MSKPPVIAIVACEHSADNYAGLLARELKRQCPGVKLIGLGGPEMEAAGVEIICNTVENAATGVVEILGALKFYTNAMRDLIAACKREGASAAVLLDSPEFNLRAAPRLKDAGVKTAYYISPQLWVWRSGRVEQVRRQVDEMLVIFPFEKTWYAERGIDVTFVGHPMLDLIDLDEIRGRGAALKQELIGDSGDMLIGILPGSRRNEISGLMPRFLEAARLLRKTHPKTRFAIGCPPRLTPDKVAEWLKDYPDLNAVPLHGKTHDLMAAGDYLLCCSGTATLEAALIGTPHLMAYRLKWLSFLLLRTFIFTDDNALFSLPNIVMGRRVIQEMIQFQTDPVTLSLAAAHDIDKRLPELRAAFAEVPGLLGGGGASARAAERALALAGWDADKR